MRPCLRLEPIRDSIPPTNVLVMAIAVILQSKWSSKANNKSTTSTARQHPATPTRKTLIKHVFPLFTRISNAAISRARAENTTLVTLYWQFLQNSARATVNPSPTRRTRSAANNRPVDLRGLPSIVVLLPPALLRRLLISSSEIFLLVDWSDSLVLRVLLTDSGDAITIGELVIPDECVSCKGIDSFEYGLRKLRIRPRSGSI